MDKQRLGIIIIAVIGMLATFMPWIKAPIVGTINGTEEEGWNTFFLFAIPLLLSIINGNFKSMGKGLALGLIIPSLVAAIIGLWHIINFNSDKNANLITKAFGKGFSIEFGLYLVVLSGIAIPIVVLWMRGRAPK